MRSVLSILFLLISIVPVPAFGQARPTESGSILLDTDQRQIAFSSALVLAGFAGETKDPIAVELRANVSRLLANVEPALKARLQEFYKANRRVEVEESTDALRYRALAVISNPPPSFSVVIPEGRIPADVKPLVSFAHLVSLLYQSPAYKAAIPELTEAYDSATRQIGVLIRPTVLNVLSYLRTQPIRAINVAAIRGEDGRVIRPAFSRLRRLRIFVDPILSGQAVAIRSDLMDAGDDPDAQRPGDRYAVFAGSSVSPDEAALRLCLIRFVLDPIVQGATDDLRDSRKTFDELLGSNQKALNTYGSNQVALIVDSLVTALNARLMRRAERVSDAGAVAYMGDAYDRGEILALHFYGKLGRYEETGFDIGVYFPEFLRTLDLKAERSRAGQIAQARELVAAEPKKASPTADDEFATEILAADRLINEKKFDAARPVLERILQRAPENPRALFGLAQVIEHTPDPVESVETASDEDKVLAQAERLETAVRLYRRAAETASSRETWISSWGHVYAGRILDFLELRDEAIDEYTAAVKLGDVPQGAYREAQQGLTAPFDPEHP